MAGVDLATVKELVGHKDIMRPSAMRTSRRVTRSHRLSKWTGYLQVGKKRAKQETGEVRNWVSACYYLEPMKGLKPPTLSLQERGSGG